MPRKRNPDIEKAEEELGLEPPSGNRTVGQQLARVEKAKEQKAVIQRAEHVAGAIDLGTGEAGDKLSGLSERQIAILKLTLRGIAQTAIAKMMGVSQPTVSQEMKKVTEHLRNKGAIVNQEEVVGRSLTIYEDVQKLAYDTIMQTQDPNIRLKAASTIIAAEDKKMKLLMDLGLIKRAATEIEHTLKAPNKFVEAWKSNERQAVAHTILESSMEPLPEPTPPSEDDGIVDAEWEEYDEDEESTS